MRLVGALVALVCAACGGGDAPAGDAHSADGATPDGPPPATVTLATTDYGTPRPATLVAFQDGDGAWQVATAGPGAIYTRTITTGRFGIATVCHHPTPLDLVDVRVVYARTDELTSEAIDCRLGPSSVAVTGTVTGLAPGDRWQVTFGTTSYGGTTTTYAAQVRPATYRPFAARLDAAGNMVAVLRLPRRDISAATVLDLDLSIGVALERHAVTVNGLVAGETVDTYTYLGDDSGTYVELDEADEGSWPTLPASQSAPGDLYDVWANAVSGTGQTRFVGRTVATGADQSFSPPPGLVTTGATLASTTPVRLQATVDRVAPAFGYTLWAFQFSAPAGVARTFAVAMTAGRAGTAATLTIAHPDLSGVPGWDPAWSLQTGDDVSWNVGAGWSNQNLAAYFRSQHDDGLEIQGADASGSLTP